MLCEKQGLQTGRLKERFFNSTQPKIWTSRVPQMVRAPDQCCDSWTSRVPQVVRAPDQCCEGSEFERQNLDSKSPPIFFVLTNSGFLTTAHYSANKIFFYKKFLKIHSVV